MHQFTVINFGIQKQSACLFFFAPVINCRNAVTTQCQARTIFISDIQLTFPFNYM